MPIRPSPAAEIRQLIDALSAAESVRREAAIARLTVLGAPAFEHLIRAYPSAELAETRAGMLRVLEASSDARAGALARQALADSSPAVTAAAVGALRSLLGRSDSAAARDALDALVSLVLDRSRPEDCRLGAFDALRDLPESTLAPLKAALGNDPLLKAAGEGAPTTQPATISGADKVWTSAIEGTLPDVPDVLKAAVAGRGGSAKLIQLQRLVDLVRAREGRETDRERREGWLMLRGALHQALAERGSRLALYDLRDSLSSAERLPVAFLAALEEVGDASCLEALAAAYEASSGGSDPWWRDHLAAAFRAIVHREGLTRRHAVVKRAMARWPQAAADLMARS